MKPQAAYLAVVELREARGEWPAGTIGTVVEVSADGALVEIVDEDGRTLELLSVPHAALRLRDEAPARRGAAG
jgi:hypothetical protein